MAPAREPGSGVNWSNIAVGTLLSVSYVSFLNTDVLGLGGIMNMVWLN